jgi:hypothetical protein
MQNVNQIRNADERGGTRVERMAPLADAGRLRHGGQ